MRFALTLTDVSLWLAAITIILLITSEVLYSSPWISTRLKYERSRLRLVAVGCGLVFSVTIVIRIVQYLGGYQ
jgi:hypothetical protein